MENDATITTNNTTVALGKYARNTNLMVLEFVSAQEARVQKTHLVRFVCRVNGSSMGVVRQ